MSTEMEESLCRICLADGKCTVSIVDRLADQFVWQVMVWMGEISVKESDGLPQCICVDCYANLEATLKFKSQIVAADQQLRDMYMNPSELPVKMENFKHEIDETEFIDEDAKYDSSGSENVPVTKVKEAKKQKRKRFHCCKCEKNFFYEGQRDSHFRQTHTDCFRDMSIKYSKAQKYECRLCFRRFLRKASLNKHFEDKSFVELKQEYRNPQKMNMTSKHEPKVCPTCGRIFSDKYQLALHESRVHATEKPFVCAISGCTMAFALERLLRRHFKNVHEEKRMICDFCAKLFRTMKDLRQHMYVHMEKKPLQCPQCPKTFTLARVMKAHTLASHSGIEKPFQCNECEKAYKWKEDLRAHRMVEHLGIYPFKCRFCQKGYSGSSNRNWHEKRCPNNIEIQAAMQQNLPQASTFSPQNVIQYNQF